MCQTKREFVTRCRVCQRTKSINHKQSGFLGPIEVSKSKWQVISIDIIVLLPETENRNSRILTFVDKQSKMIRLISIKSTMNVSDTEQQFKQLIYLSHGIPSKFISDRYPIFMSKFWKSLFKSLRTKLAPSSAYQPQTDGQSETANRKIEEMIRGLVYHAKDS